VAEDGRRDRSGAASWDDGAVNVLDLVLAGALVLAALSGYRRGLALQSFSVAGLLLGLAIGAVVAPVAARLVESPTSQAATATIVLIAFGALGDGIGWVLGSRVRQRARATRFRSADAAGGSVVSILSSLLAIWFIALNLVNGPFPGVAHEVRGSAIVRALDASLPQPPSLLAEVRRFFNRFGFPDVFSGIPPLPAAPVREPTKQEARTAFRAAESSTVKVVGEACDHVQEGSGFVAADGYIVTNAHVIAGVHHPFVQTATSSSAEEATPVLFDPTLDLAVLYLSTSPGPALSLATTLVERGDSGAVLGYPGGGPLTGARAAVLQSFEPTGRDIYGEGEVARAVLELQATVRPGNSGGPFVLSDGTVAGVVFAASTTDDHVGYALSSREVGARLADVVGDDQAVSTGPCIR
jgi:S1-C subfamily serine protease